MLYTCAIAVVFTLIYRKRMCVLHVRVYCILYYAIASYILHRIARGKEIISAINVNGGAISSCKEDDRTCIGYNMFRFKRDRQQNATFSIFFSFAKFSNPSFAIFTSRNNSFLPLYTHILYPLIYVYVILLYLVLKQK